MAKSVEVNENNNNLFQKLINKEKVEEDMPILKQSMSSSNSSNSNINNTNIQNEPKEYIIETLPENYTQYDKSIKVILLGDSSVGKTSILNCLEQRDILDRKTISLEYFNYNLRINNYVIRMQIWDTVGQEKFNSITVNYYKTTDVAIFIYAINDIKSFNNIELWFNALNDKGNINVEETGEKMMLKILVGNKKDLIKERSVTYKMGEKLKKEKNFNLFKEISCHYNNKTEVIYDTNTFESNLNENENLNIEQLNENEGNNENENSDEKDCIKNLFMEIAKIYYRDFIEDHGARINSSIYYYEASNSILELAPERTDSDSETKKGAKSKCRNCC